MSKISHKQARKMLSQACERYINHNAGQLAGLIAKSPYWPELYFFQEVLDKNAPSPGFNDWVSCEYYSIMRSIFYTTNKYTIELYINDELYIYEGEEPIGWEPDRCTSRFEQLKSYRGEDKKLDQRKPELVLYNLRVLTKLLNLIMIGDDSEFNNLKKNSSDYKESDYLCSEKEPLSLQVDKTLKNLLALVSFINTLQHFKSYDALCLYRIGQYNTKHSCVYSVDELRKNERLSEFIREGTVTALQSLHFRLKNDYVVFEGYLKGVVAQELKDILDNKSFSDEEAVKQVELQLKNPSIMAILEKNRQSESEQQLKLLSVIAILIGVGIFTTLGLVVKRLYDSGGTSINFFKPLSKNLCEDVNNITASIRGC